MKKYPEYESVMDANLLIASLSILNICTFFAVNVKTILGLQPGLLANSNPLTLCAAYFSRWRKKAFRISLAKEYKLYTVKNKNYNSYLQKVVQKL